MNIVIDRRIFKAAQHCMSTKDVRYYLNGICLRIDNGIKGQVYSTTGHVLFAASFNIENHAEAIKGVFDIIIPTDAVKHAAKGKTPSVDLISLDDGGYLLDGFRFIAIDGKYPDIARVIPDSNDVSNEPGHFNPALLLLCDKALAAWHDTKETATLYQNGPSNSAIMQGPDNSAISVVMPWGIDKDSPDQPYNFSVLAE
jgi:hypothetical protein